MYERIVVPLDGTPYAERALPWARVIAARAEATLRLVRVHVPLRIPTGQEVLGPRVGQALKDLGMESRDREAAYLRQTGDRLIDESGSEVTTELLQGPAAGAVARDARLRDADLIVMAPRDRKPLKRLTIGSVTEQVARCCPVPLLAVRGPTGSDPEACRLILVPLDGTERVEAAAGHGAVMGRLLDASVLLLRVVRPRRRRETETAAAYLEGVADRVHGRGVPVETRVVRHQDAAGAITEIAAETGAGMIVMSSRFRDGLPRVVRESPTEAVLRNSPVPVLLSGRRRVDGPYA